MSSSAIYLVVYDRQDWEFVAESELWQHIGAWTRADCVVINTETQTEQNVEDYSHLQYD
jgi:hypothetical protein